MALGIRRRGFTLTQRPSAGLIGMGGRGPLITSTAIANSLWPDQLRNYVTQVPGGIGYAMDSPFGSGRHLGANPQTTLLEIDNHSTSNAGTLVGTRHYRCTEAFALAFTGPKVIVESISGVTPVTRLPSQTSRYWTRAGQIAPSPGYHNLNGFVDYYGSDGLLMDQRIYCDPTKITAIDPSLIDGVAAGGFQGNSGSRIVFAYNDVHGSMDELCQGYGVSQDITLFRNNLSNPYNHQNHPSGEAHGLSVIAGDDNLRFAMIQNLIQHGSGRILAYSRSPAFIAANNLVYNAGVSASDTYFGWFNMDACGSPYGRWPSYVTGDVIPSLTNLISNLWISGPSTLFAQYPVQVGDGRAFPAGSKLCLQNNCMIGSFPQTTQSPQSGLIRYFSSVPSDFLQAAALSGAYPQGLQIRTLLDTAADALAFALLIRDTAGARTADRTGWSAFTPMQALKRLQGLSGTTTIGKVIDGPADYGGLPTDIATVNSINLFSVVDMLGDPLITVEQGRDALQASGLTWLEEWLIRWHYRRRAVFVN